MKCSLCNKNINENEKHSYDTEEGNYHCEECMTLDDENSEKTKRTRTMKTKNTYYFELTDTFGGELNYCHLHRFIISANSVRGALIKLSKHTGLNFRSNGLYYKAKNACLAAYEIENEIDTSWLDSAELIK